MKASGAAVLGIALIISAAVLGFFFRDARVPKHTIQVVGSASRSFTTDIVKWNLTISRTAGIGAVTRMYPLLNEDVTRITDVLTAAGVDSGDITVQPVVTNTNQNYQEGTITGYTLLQTLTIISEDIDVVEKLALNPDAMVNEGLILQQSNLEYYYSEVDQLKRELLGHAAEDAKQRAEEIAASTGVTVGAITDAQAGVFQITEPYSTEVSSYGIYNTSSRDKDIKVTVHATFVVE